MTNWTIEARASDVVGGLGGHVYLSFWDSSGSLVAQINGMARNQYTGEISFVGQDNWPTEAVVTDHAIIGGSANTHAGDTNPSVVLFSGSEADFNAALALAKSA